MPFGDDDEGIQSDGFEAGSIKQCHIQTSSELLCQYGICQPDTLPVLEAFARFTVRLHEQGICHEDFNQTNILWRHDEATGRYHFQLIDINRMKFLRRPLRPDECMINLRRLSCPAVAFLYILDRYAETRQWDMDDTLLRGTFFRLLFGRRQQFKKRFKARKLAAAGKKQG